MCIGNKAFYHPHVNVIEIYANTAGYSVDGSGVHGGSLLYSLFGTLRKVDLKMWTLLHCMNVMNTDISEAFGGNQVIQCQSTFHKQIYFQKRS